MARPTQGRGNPRPRVWGSGEGGGGGGIGRLVLILFNSRKRYGFQAKAYRSSTERDSRS